MELSLTKLFGGSRYLVQSIHAEKLQVGIFSQLGWISPLLTAYIDKVNRTIPNVRSQRKIEIQLIRTVRLDSQLLCCEADQNR